MAVGALEPAFYARLLQGLRLESELVHSQMDASRWPHVAELFEERFRQRTMADWGEVFAGVDACVAPVLTAQEAADDPHLSARQTYAARSSEPGSPISPGTAPRFSRTPAQAGWPMLRPGRHTEEVLAELAIGR
jgi:alpha-methylacyl-CoA racemase